MKTFKIFYGLINADEDIKLQSILDFKDEEEALDYAYFEAVSLYDSSPNLYQYEDIEQQIIDNLTVDDEISDMELANRVNVLYQSCLNEWIKYYVEEVINE